MNSTHSLYFSYCSISVKTTMTILKERIDIGTYFEFQRGLPVQSLSIITVESRQA